MRGGFALIGFLTTLTYFGGGSDQSLEQVAGAMSRQRASAALVTDDASIVGILTERDLLRACAEGLVHWSTRVHECMTRDPVCISPPAPTRRRRAA